MICECSKWLPSAARAIGVAMLGLLVSAPSVHAQVLYGSLVGNVTDGSGAAVPGAAVTVTNTETQASREAVTDESGVYRVTTIQPGPYKVRVALTGFGTSNRDVVVTPNNVTRVDVALSVGDLSESVTVNGASRSSNNTRIDGVSTMNLWLPHLVALALA